MGANRLIILANGSTCVLIMLLNRAIVIIDYLLSVTVDAIDLSIDIPNIFLRSGFVSPD